MKRRLLLVYICIILCMALTGCEKNNGTQEKVVNSQELVSYDISTERADDEVLAEEKSFDEEVLTAEESVSYENDIYISKFFKEDSYLLSEDEEFYEMTALNPIIQMSETGAGESTLDMVQKAYEKCDMWNQQIDYTGTQLNSLLNDSECEKLQEVLSIWDEYYKEKVSLYQNLFGVNGIIPGSMYTQIAADTLVDDNKLMAYALLSLEYELSQNVQFAIESEDRKLSPENINWYDFSAENLCIEYCQDFEEMLDSYSLDEKSSEELEVLISETANMIQEKMGNNFDLVLHVNKYISIINKLNEIEGQVSSDNRHITVKEERLKLYLTQLLNIEFMLEEY